MLLLFATLLVQISSAGAQSLDGIWQTRGYGYIFVINDSTLKAFEITTTTCVPGLTARRSPSRVAGFDAVFKSKEEGKLFFRLTGTGNRAILRFEDSVPDIDMDSIAKMPAVCVQTTPNTPIGNFEVFVQTWAENYISFDRRRVDWENTVAEYRKKVTAETTAAQLFDILQAMIKPLGDIHTYIAAPALKRSTPEFWRPGTDRIVKKSVDELPTTVDGISLRSPMKITCTALPACSAGATFNSGT